MRVSNNGAERRREARVRPAAVEEVAGSGWGGQGDAPRRSLEGVCLRAGPLRPRARLPAGSPTAVEPESMVPAPGLI